MIELSLPYPPSVNHLYATVRGRRVLSKKGREYKSSIAELVALQKHAPELKGDIGVMIDLYPPDRRRRDIDNPVKPLLDALTKSGIWSDDSQVKLLSVQMGPKRQPASCVVNIYEL